MLYAAPLEFVALGDELARRGPAFPLFEPLEESDATANEIAAAFRRRLAGLRRLPRHERIAALKAARELKLASMRSLVERRATERHARYTQWRAQLPAFRQI